ncbi:MAG: phage head spike fiber domain-containing protein [Acidobacteriota bacterium]
MGILFPPAIYPDYGATEEDVWDEQIQRSTTALVQVRIRRSSAPRWLIEAAWTLAGADFATIEEFLRGLQGAGYDAYLFTFNREAWWPPMSAGTGDGSKTDFPFPGRDVVLGTEAVNVGGVAKVRGTDFEIGREQRCLQSEDFSQTGVWVAQGGATVTRTSGQSDPLGGTKAWRIQTSGGTTAAKLQQTVNTPASGTKLATSVWVRVNSSSTVYVDDGISGSVAVVQSDGWREVRIQSTGAGGSRLIRFTAAGAGYSLDFYVFHPFAADGNAVETMPLFEWGYIPAYAAALTYDTTTGKDRIAFYSASKPANGQEVTLSYQGRRLLLGRVISRRPRIAVDYGVLVRGLVFEGEEAS